MVEIPASLVKDLRDATGAGLMECKQALKESNGDKEKAVEWLRQKGIATASKKASRAASEGLVAGHVNADGTLGAIVEVNCETDFVAKNDEFVALTRQIAELAAKHKPKDADALLGLAAESGTIKELVIQKVAKIGENIQVRRLKVFELNGTGGVGLYVHAVGGKMGALVELSTSKAVPAADLVALAREIAMHTVSSKPVYISRDEIPAEVIDNERRIESGKADLADKKPEIREKIVQGRVDKLFGERCLIEQPFVKDSSVTVAQYLKTKGSQWGAEIKPTRFALYILGEASQAPEEEAAALVSK